LLNPVLRADSAVADYGPHWHRKNLPAMGVENGLNSEMALSRLREALQCRLSLVPLLLHVKLRRYLPRRCALSFRQEIQPRQQRMLAMFEQAALNDYPNPDRVGCPGSAFLERLARNRRSIPITHPDLIHVARCSPCSREFSEYRQEAARRPRQTQRAILAAVIVAGCGSAAFFAAGPVSSWFGSRGSGQYVAATLDLKDRAIVRGLTNRVRRRHSIRCICLESGLL